MPVRLETTMGVFLAERLGGVEIHPKGGAVQADVQTLIAFVRARDAGRDCFIARTPEHALWEMPFAPMRADEAEEA